MEKFQDIAKVTQTYLCPHYYYCHHHHHRHHHHHYVSCVQMYADVRAYCSHAKNVLLRGHVCCPLIHDSLFK